MLIINVVFQPEIQTLYLRSCTGPTTDGAQNVKAEVGGDDAEKNEDGSQNQTALFECKWNRQDTSTDDCCDQSKRRRDESRLACRAVVLRVQNFYVGYVIIVRLGRRWGHGILWGEH